MALDSEGCCCDPTHFTATGVCWSRAFNCPDLTVQTNYEDGEALIKKLHHLMETILSPEGRHSLKTSSAQEILDETHKALEQIKPFLVNLARKKSLMKRIVLASADKEAILKFQLKVDSIRADFRDRAIKQILVNTDALKPSTTNGEQYRVLRREDIALECVWRNPSNVWDILSGIYEPTRTPVLVFKYKAGRTLAAEKEFLRVVHESRDYWAPNIPQFHGASYPTDNDRFLVLKGPQGDGRVAKYISTLPSMHPNEASKHLLRMLRGFVSGAKYSLEATNGQCGLTEYDVYIGEQGQLVVYNFGLLLDQRIHGPHLLLKDWRHWDAFVSLFTKTLTNDSEQLNYVRGQIAPYRRPVIRLVKHLVIFAWDFANTVGDRIRNTSNAAVTTMLGAFLQSISQVEMHLDNVNEDDSNPLLTAMVEVFGRKLSGIWDLDVPQDIATGDIGYMAGSPTDPQFVRLGNVLNEIGDVRVDERPFQTIQYRPSPEFWSEDLFDGFVRHKCEVTNVPTNDTLFRVERGHRSGRLDESLVDGRMRWDCSRAWNYLLKQQGELHDRYTELDENDLMLIFSHKQSSGYGFIRIISNSLTPDERRTALQAEGFDGDILYFFENITPSKGELWGYWSREPFPGHPIWPPSVDAEGFPWAWDARTEHCRVEVSRVGPQQHIRYLQP
ncbi:hypothetical protein K439DRAFT_1639526 [Ramaria rubella]|nr:hypothetical protein K439DRAFT_1639526 [Ramaria rubella]